jgi:hypothetical protein
LTQIRANLEYRFLNLGRTATIIQEHNDPSNNPPISISKFFNIWQILLFEDDAHFGLATDPLIVPPGIIYGDNAASLISGFATSTPFSFAFWVYLFRTDQVAYLFSKVKMKSFLVSSYRRSLSSSKNQ